MPVNKVVWQKVGDLIVLLILAGLVVWYFLDARAASASIQNLILILPVTVIVLFLCLLQFFRSVRSQPATDATHPASVRDVVPAVGLFVVYVLTLPWLGFDVGTAIFIGAFLWVHGERRVSWVLGYAVSFASLIALFFSSMLPYPMPMLVFST